MAFGLLAALLVLAIGVSVSGGDPGGDNVTTVTAPPTAEQPGEPPDEATPAPEGPSGPPEDVELPPGTRRATPAEVSEHVPPDLQGIVTGGIVVKEDPSKIVRGPECPPGPPEDCAPKQDSAP